MYTVTRWALIRITCILPVISFTGASIDLLVWSISPNIFDGVFHGGHRQYTKERDPRDFLSERFDGRYEIEDYDQKKVEIGSSVELFKEVFG